MARVSRREVERVRRRDSSAVLGWLVTVPSSSSSRLDIVVIHVSLATVPLMNVSLINDMFIGNDEDDDVLTLG